MMSGSASDEGAGVESEAAATEGEE
jgi:hypothetical protein